MGVVDHPFPMRELLTQIGPEDARTMFELAFSLATHDLKRETPCTYAHAPRICPSLHTNDRF